MSNVDYLPPETLTVRLSRRDSGVSWGFRLQGGMDFNIPLSVQSVNPNSVADRAGLQAGDGILFINQTNTDQLNHEQAKMEIIRSGNEIYMTIIRGAVEVWRPKVTPMSDLRPQELRQIKTATGDTVTAVQKTSLAKDSQLEPLKIGSSHNRSAKPFGGQSQYQPPQPEYQQQQQYRQPPPQQQQYQPPPPQQQYRPPPQQQQRPSYQQQQRGPQSPTSPKAPVPTVVHAQFNSPIGLYSANKLAETYDVQTRGIQKQMENLDVDEAPVGMKISGTTYQPVSDEGSAGEEDPPEAPGHSPPPNKEDVNSNSVQCEDINNQHDSDNTNPIRPSGFRSVTAPKFDPTMAQSPKQESMHCVKCGNMVSGVFVKIKGRPFHAQCFTCTSCGVNLKQKGYFVIDDCLYCEIHAKQKAEAPGPNMKLTDVVYR